MGRKKNPRDLIQQQFTARQAEEAAALLSERWRKNSLDTGIIKGKTVLDIGCGSGRYSHALRKMGAKKVVGIDEGKMKRAGGAGISFKSSSLLKMPFAAGSFDFVFCNGALSHTKRWKKGLEEANRVLRRGGWLWVSLYGKGKVWDYAEKISGKMNFGDAENFTRFLLLRDWEPNKIFFLLDSFFSGGRVYFTRKQAESELRKAGFVKIEFLRRGTGRDLNEKIFRNPKLKKIYGEGELRFIAQKK